MKATFKRLLNGRWGLKVDGYAAPGNTVTVVKKSGETGEMVIDRVLWSGKGLSICTFVPTPKGPPAKPLYPTRIQRQRNLEDAIAEAKIMDDEWAAA